MNMPPFLRKLTLMLHITASVGWLGAVVAYIALAVAALTSQNIPMIPAAWLAMELVGWYVIVPLAMASLLSGVIQSVGTTWGLFRHYWVLIKFVLTSLATAILIQHMPTVSYFAGVATQSSTHAHSGLTGEVVHAGGGLLVLLVTTTLSVYKPRGMTPYGWRKQQALRRMSATQDLPRL